MSTWPESVLKGEAPNNIRDAVANALVAWGNCMSKNPPKETGTQLVNGTEQTNFACFMVSFYKKHGWAPNEDALSEWVKDNT